ncbi:uncharacterized protein LOC118270273 isoform X1 [Spodoptera frugiperda]|uniref:Uncharacterized protein LOC118270273 isoform X1 n=1 Tax=Spodoptera frugiperda TaxID=7108 RepID=A0A9R0EXK7_SPOFR|nr:uncharacterized protein LOC118270273 isoform X1 [Spodoptera frugiperda]
MSHTSNITLSDGTEDKLESIREEQISPTASTVSKPIALEDLKKDISKCTCKRYYEMVKDSVTAERLEEILKEKEEELRSHYDQILEREREAIKERFDFILLNEQTRASYMLREAHRERQEKIRALQTQLQCKNLAALMYVMCTERRRSRLEKLRIIRDYKNYIDELHEILTEGQELILYLSKGYKTAARVDHEWREKMKKVVKQFMAFIYNYTGGTPEANQYLIDLPKLLKIEAPIDVNPEEDPCEPEEEPEQPEADEISRELEWWETSDKDCKERPFVMFGDMEDFTPNQRRQVLKNAKRDKNAKAQKTAPGKWKEYAFRTMFLKSRCCNLGQIKDMYANKLPLPTKFECMSYTNGNGNDKDTMKGSKLSISGARGGSVDIRGNMGSILKIITSVPNAAPVNAKTELLGARDSMEITSTTRLRERVSIKPTENHPKTKILNIGRKRGSVFDVPDEEELVEKPVSSLHPHTHDVTYENIDQFETESNLGSIHNDSLQMINNRVPDTDRKINYERVCPMEKCQRMQVDSFMRSLPPYMRANPFTLFEQNFDHYETCSPEQLAMLKERIEHKKTKEVDNTIETEDPMEEWVGHGIAVQTSEGALDLPPCTCHVPSPSPASTDVVFNVQDLIPIKQAMDAIHRECLYDERINFDRFKLIGQESRSLLQEEIDKENEKEFKQARYDDIKKILNQHPSLLDIFQANVK